ncbi:MAG: PCMD domain-containing protein, partial [Muribaculaceae bacterium]|nr:PCMD domain-containing protein [Muribaculaceae bacterium]
SGWSPNSEYEVRGVAGEVTDGSYEFESAVSTFSTESEFVIPNASMEEWSTYSAQTMLGKKNVVLPDAGGDKLTSFWGSGNEGSATANMTLTNKNTDMFHSGAAAARLASNSAFKVLAAGNLFVGNYKETYETSNGKLSFGREYDGSHPSKMRVWVNYRPGVVDVIKSGMDNYVPAGFSGSSDHGQIYVALTTGEIEVRTGSDRKLFSPEPDGNSDARVVGYGQVTWDSNYGADGSLEMLEIPIEYNSIAKTVKPTHLIIVCTASKYGDYFCGSSKSVMYVDDFELVYE